MAAASVQLRAEFNHVINIGEMKSALLERQRALNPPKKVFLPRKRLPNKKYDTHVLVILVALLQERENSKGRCCTCVVHTQKGAYAAPCLIYEYIYMYAWVYFSEWERLYYRCSQSLNSGITDNSSLRPSSLAGTSHCRQH